MSLMLSDARRDALAEMTVGRKRECLGCRAPFVAAKGFESLCAVCFKLDRAYALYAGDKALLWLQEEHRKQTDEVAQLTDRYRRVRAKAKQLMKTAASTSMSPQKIEQLIRLCHPDRHGDSQVATEMTQWLLAMRSK